MEDLPVTVKLQSSNIFETFLKIVSHGTFSKVKVCKLTSILLLSAQNCVGFTHAFILYVI